MTQLTLASARRQILLRTLAGTVVTLVCAAFVAVGLLLYAYVHVDPEFSSTSLRSLLGRLVYFLYRRTQFLRLVWDHAAVPDASAPLSRDTLAFCGWYVGGFLGAALLASARELARRLRAAEQHAGAGAPVTVQPVSMWRQVRSLYVAPVLLGLALLGLAQLPG